MFRIALPSTFILALATCRIWAATIVVDFEDLSLPPQSANFGDSSQQPFVSHGVQFTRQWSTEFDCCPTGWAYSNTTDLRTAGYTNPYSAYVPPNGGGVTGSTNFAVANNLVRGEAIIHLPQPTTVLGMYLTTTTYNYLAIANGDDGGAGFIKGPFVEGDWFKLTVIGMDGSNQQVGERDFYLADFRGANRTVVADWTWLDLTSLGNNVASLEFELTSTDTGPFGMNTPAYFALDDLTIANVPESSSPTLLFLAVALGRRLHCRRSRHYSGTTVISSSDTASI
jgi:hypothetical protein